MESPRELASLELYRAPLFPDETARDELYIPGTPVRTIALAELHWGVESLRTLASLELYRAP
eukprot:11766400-Alexandrium_andersonii.AAC.1